MFKPFNGEILVGRITGYDDKGLQGEFIWRIASVEISYFLPSCGLPMFLFWCFILGCYNKFALHGISSDFHNCIP
jgi:hypothetical protein